MLILLILSHKILELEDNLDVIQIIIRNVWNQSLFSYHISEFWPVSGT